MCISYNYFSRFLFSCLFFLQLFTLFPYTTLFRSRGSARRSALAARHVRARQDPYRAGLGFDAAARKRREQRRSEERRVGKECRWGGSEEILDAESRGRASKRSVNVRSWSRREMVS